MGSSRPRPARGRWPPSTLWWPGQGRRRGPSGSSGTASRATTAGCHTSSIFTCRARRWAPRYGSRWGLLR
eukprot:131113-Prymnesium_polylepis.1